MQFMPETAARYALTNPHDPQTAIDAGARYFRDLLRKFDGRVDLALAAYNAGEGTVEAFRTGRSLRLANGKVINRAQEDYWWNSSLPRDPGICALGNQFPQQQSNGTTKFFRLFAKKYCEGHRQFKPRLQH